MSETAKSEYRGSIHQRQKEPSTTTRTESRGFPGRHGKRSTAISRIRVCSSTGRKFPARTSRYSSEVRSRCGDWMRSS